jgi:hypothetical protein
MNDKRRQIKLFKVFSEVRFGKRFNAVKGVLLTSLHTLIEPARIPSNTSTGRPPGLAAVFNINGGTAETRATLTKRFVP